MAILELEPESYKTSLKCLIGPENKNVVKQLNGLGMPTGHGSQRWDNVSNQVVPDYTPKDKIHTSPY